ncbi:MAG: glycosyltransferase family 39 protein [Lachnospiraceae bacterium]|nr:glycosyltransferase family 39 protein [Lachnospiraceae bacterium]
MRYFIKSREQRGTAFFITGKKRERSWEEGAFLLLFLGMAVYYGYRMFALTPWYDELYTYYYFISRGPVYAAIHWPLPNNHVGYSALSACLGIFGSAPVALRGVSYLCSLGSLVLLYRISRKCFTKGVALLPVFVFASLYMVNQLAVQGRGYALVTFCYLTAILTLYHIVAEKKDNKRDYICFGLALVISLWAIPSSLYVVMPICLIGGFLLLLQKEYRRLGRLISVSLVSAVCTAGLYGILWLAVGSNLLSKTPDGPFYTAGHIEIILHAPFQALSEGISYMLDTPYIQSMTRQAFSAQADHWLRTLFRTQLAPLFGLPRNGWCILLAAALLLAVGWLIKKRGEPAFLEWYFVLTALLLALVLFIQCKLPYQRVFSFLGVWVALLLGWLVQKLVDFLQRHCGVWKRGSAAGCVIVLALGLAGISYAGTFLDQSPYSMRDELIRDAYAQIDLDEADVVAVTDCDQEYLMLYLYDRGEDQVTRQIEEADVVLLDKALLGLNYDYREDPEEWKFYLSKEEVEGKSAYLNENMTQVYENWQFVMFAENQARMK